MQQNLVILLADQDQERMCSKEPIALHSLCGRTVFDWVMRHFADWPEPPVALLGYGADKIRAYYGERLRYIEHESLFGTIGTLLHASELIGKTQGRVIVVAGNLPMLKKQSIDMLVNITAEAASLATVQDADTQRAEDIGAYSFDAKFLFELLTELKESFNTITLEKFVAQLKQIKSGIEQIPVSYRESLSVTDRAALSACARELRREINIRHMFAGVTMIDPDNTYIDDTVRIGRDCTIYPGVVLEGETVLGEDCVLYPSCRLSNSRFGSGMLAQGVVANDAVVGDNVTLGPYVHLRPNTNIADNCKIGNYIEVKNSNVGEGTKLPHLSYIGDADFGRRVNVGCGSVCVNYDGQKKHRTTIGDDAFIGCNTSLVAPVSVGEGAYTAAGSVITQDVPPNSLALGRARQVNKPGYVEKLREKRK
ncbi:hypothetical protein LJC42_08670 [Eubacteriales bacterium OttesenSCG-928-K08]|nr:hypothetical protein [Eubacteriales bacterium OttesenSCG-928-K08]